MNWIVPEGHGVAKKMANGKLPFWHPILTLNSGSINPLTWVHSLSNILLLFLFLAFFGMASLDRQAD
jgi:hypothetical protein